MFQHVVVAIPILLSVGFTLTAIALFSPDWVYVTTDDGFATVGFGVVPFPSHLDGSKFESSLLTYYYCLCIIIYIALGAYVVLFLSMIYAVVSFVYRGLSSSTRHAFIIMPIICLFVIIPEVTAFAFMIVVDSYRLLVKNAMFDDVLRMGQCAYMALLSAILTLIAGCLSTLIAIFGCRASSNPKSMSKSSTTQ